MTSSGIDGRYRHRMETALSIAAAEFNATVAGTLQFGWRDRTVSAKVVAGGQARWLRLVSEPIEYPVDVFWTGNTDAAQIPRVRRPTVLDVWESADVDMRLRAELMTLVDETVCSPTPVAETPIRLSKSWWAQLTDSLDALGTVTTQRQALTVEQFASRIRVWEPGLDVRVERWSPAHADLHWANLTRPGCWILDWEGWGMAPAGFDAATLYLHSLPVTDLAQRVRELAGDLLNSRDALLCQLYVAARMLARGDLDSEPARTIILAHIDTVSSALAGQASSADR